MMRALKSVIKGLSLCGLTFVLFACTRSESEKTRVSFALPAASPFDQQSMSVELVHIVFNIQKRVGDSFAPVVVCNWDRKGQISGPCEVAFPNVVTEIQSDPNNAYLVQVLLVYDQSTATSGDAASATKIMSFAYGDNYSSMGPISGTESQIPIRVSPFGGTSASQGQISGRYLSAAADGPSGKLFTKFRINNVVPSMTLFDQDIFSGWFQGFALQGIAFDYELNGQLLFGKSMMMEDWLALASQNPTAIKTATNSSYSNETKILGFFGPGVANQRTCSTTSCVNQGGTEFVDFLKSDAVGSDPSYFSGAFKKRSGGGLLGLSGTNLTWSFLPGISANVIDGVRVFKMTNMSLDQLRALRRDPDQWDCNQVQMNPNSTEISAGTLAFPISELAVGNTTLAANEAIFTCVVRLGGLLNVASVLSPLWGSSGGGGNNGPLPPTKIEVLKNSWPNLALTENLCHRFEVYLRDNNGNMAPAASAFSATFSVNGSAAVYFNDSNSCVNNTGAQSGLSFNTGDNNKSVYFKVPILSAVNFDLQFNSVSNGVLAKQGLNLPLKSASALALSADGPNPILPNLCYRYAITSRQMPGNAISPGSNLSVSLVAAGMVSIYSDSSCLTATSAVTILSGTVQSNVYVKLSGVSNAPNTITMSAAGYETMSSLIWGGPGDSTPTQISIFGSMSPMLVNQCNGPYSVELKNATMTTTLAASQVSFSVGGISGSIYSDQSCTTNAPGVIAAGDYNTQVYFKPTVVGGGTVNLTASGLTSVPFNYSVASGPPTQMVVAKDTWPNMVVMSYSCVPFEVKLLDAGGVPAINSGSVTSSIFVNGSGSNFYLNSSECYGTTNAQTTLTFTSGQNLKQIFLYTPSETAVTLTIIPNSVSPGGITPVALTVGLKNSSATLFSIEAPMNLVPNICYQADLVLRGIYGSTMIAGGNITVGLSLNGPILAYSDSSCSSSITSATISGGSSKIVIFIKLTSNFPETNIGTSASGHETNAQPFRSAMGAGTPTQINVTSGPNSVALDACSGPYTVSLQNASNSIVPAIGNTSYTLSSSLGNFYDSNSCSTSYSSSFVAGEHTKFVYYKSSSAGNTTVSVTSSGLGNSPSNIVINGIYQVQMNMIEANPIPNGTCVELNIEFRNNANNPVTSSTDRTVNFSGFPANSIFTNRIAGHCLGQLSGSSFVFPQYVASQTFYFLATNVIASTFSPANLRVTTAGLLNSSNLGINISPPPALSSLAPNGNFAAEYPLDFAMFRLLFSGIPSFTYAITSGAGSINSSTGVYSPAGPGAVSLSQTDNTSATFTSNLTAVSRSVQLDFTTGTLPGGLTFTRSASAYYVDNTGFLVSAAPNNARYFYNPDPGSGHPMMGLLIESASTNLIALSEQLNSAPWSPNSTTSSVTYDAGVTTPTGTSGAFKIVENNPEAFNVGFLPLTFTSAMAPNTDYTLSAFVKKDTSRYAAMFIQQNTQGTAGVVVDLDTGLTKAMTGPWTPQYVVDHGSIPHNNGWYRVWVRIHTTSATNWQGWIALLPAFANSAGPFVTNGEVSATGTTYFWGVQVETGSQMTSYVQTTGTTMTRPADQLTWTFANITGFANSAGTFRFEFIDNHSSTAGNNESLLYFNHPASGDAYKLLKNANHTVKFETQSGGSGQSTVNTDLPLVRGQVNKVCASYGPLATFVAGNGEFKPNPGARTALSHNGTGTYYLASDPGDNNLNAYLRFVEYWPYVMTGPSCGSLSK